MAASDNIKAALQAAGADVKAINAALAGIHGIPAGGTPGQVLAKTSATNYAVGWTTLLAGAASIQVVASLPGTPDANTIYITTT